jgi:Mn2+/Fe2+ NRAMP family transporter
MSPEVDPGNFATNIQAGARYGYELLWVALSANLIAMLFQALSAKVGIATGWNLAELCREHFTAPVVYAMWVASELAAMAAELAELLGASLGLTLLSGTPLLRCSLHHVSFIASSFASCQPASCVSGYDDRQWGRVGWLRATPDASPAWPKMCAPIMRSVCLSTSTFAQAAVSA